MSASRQSNPSSPTSSNRPPPPPPRRANHKPPATEKVDVDDAAAAAVTAAVTPGPVRPLPRQPPPMVKTDDSPVESGESTPLAVTPKSSVLQRAAFLENSLG